MSRTFMGAEGRYEDYVYLEMMQREWNRPIESEDSFFGNSPQLSSVIASFHRTAFLELF